MDVPDDRNEAGSEYLIRHRSYGMQFLTLKPQQWSNLDYCLAVSNMGLNLPDPRFRGGAWSRRAGLFAVGGDVSSRAV